MGSLRTLHHDVVRIARQAVEGALGEDGIIEERDPLLDRTVARDDRRAATVTLEDHLVEIAGLLAVEAA